MCVGACGCCLRMGARMHVRALSVVPVTLEQCVIDEGGCEMPHGSIGPLGWFEATLPRPHGSCVWLWDCLGKAAPPPPRPGARGLCL